MSTELNEAKLRIDMIPERDRKFVTDPNYAHNCLKSGNIKLINKTKNYLRFVYGKKEGDDLIKYLLTSHSLS